MHILFLCNEYPPGKGGGIGSFTRSLARRLVKSGYTATVLGQQRVTSETIEDDQGVTVFRTPAVYTPVVNPFVNAMSLYRSILKIHRKNPVDIIEGQEIVFWALPKNTPGVKIIRIHGGHHFFSVTLGRKPKWFRGLLERNSFRNADFFCAVSGFAAEETRRLLKLGNVTIHILPNPVDTKLFCPRASILEEPGRIIFVGAIREKKGIRQLIAAMPTIIDQIPEAHLIAVGKDTANPYTGRSFTTELQQNLPEDLHHRIQFLGPIQNEDLPDLLASAQVCAYPSHMETQGIVTIEGMSMAKLVVASQTGPGPEIIQHGSNGLLCDPYDPVSIARETIRGLGDATLRNEMGYAARKTVEEKFDIEVIFEQNLAFYRDCLARTT